MRIVWAIAVLVLAAMPAFAQISSPSTTQPTVVTGSTQVPTYSAAVIALSNTAASDLYCVGGSATKVVKIKGIRISGVATAAIVGDVSIVLRSAANSGGGAAPLALVAMDQLNPAATATVTTFTSAPTLGTAIGPIRSRKIAVSTQGNSAVISEGLFQFSVYWDQPVTLRGTREFACVHVSAFGAGASWDIDHEHTEE